MLQQAQALDAGQRTQAEAQLKQFQVQNYPSFLISLSAELANNDKPADTRRLAGLILKNALDAKEERLKASLAQQWLQVDAVLRQQIKQALLGTLAAQDSNARHTTALVIAKVAAIEVPHNAWPELIAALLGNMSSTPVNNGLRTGTLETLGYVCEELGAMKDDFLEQEQVDNILTAVVQGMRRDEPDPEVRLAATTALYNALEFAHSNFENDQERNYIMQVVCEGTVSPEPRVRQASLECLVKIAASYYDKLAQYMTHILEITARAVKDPEEGAALQAIEFWSTVAEEEIDIQRDIDDGVTGVTNHAFIKGALSHLVPILLEQLTKQEEGQDQDDGSWNLAMGGGACLELAAQAAADDIVGLVMPYVQENINKNTGNPEDWRWREAATFAFGSILEGPSTQQLAQLVNMGLTFLLQAMKDPFSQVRTTTAWTIGRIFEFVHGVDPQPPIITGSNLPQIMQVLLESIKDEPHIAEKVCYALSQLFVGFAEVAGQTSGASPMSVYFKDVVQALLETAARPCEPHEALKLQVAAFVAIQEVVRTCPDDTLPLVAQLVPVILGKLGETLQVHVNTAEEREKVNELQGLLCGLLQVSVQRLGEDTQAATAVQQVADPIMEMLLRVLASRPGGVHEEAMLAVGALTNGLGAEFLKYMDSFFPVLEIGLANHQDWHACLVTVGCLGDISRAIGPNLAPYCDRLMTTLLSNLQSNEVHRNIKPQILSVFGDVALAIEDKFEKYLGPVLQMLQSAQALSVAQQQTGDEEYADYNNMLRHGIFEAYAGLLNGLPPAMCNQYLGPFAAPLLEYVEAVYEDRESADEGVTKAALEIIGDLAMRVQAVGPLLSQKPFVAPFVQECRTSGDNQLVEAANWVATVLNKTLAAA